MTPIKDLRPTDESAAAHRTALRRIEAERAEAAAGIAQAKDARAEALLNGGPRDIEKAEKSSRELELYVEQLDALAERLRPLLGQAEASEACAAYDIEAAKFAEKKARFDAWASGEYPQMVKQFKAAFALENELFADATRLASMSAAQRGVRPATVSMITASMPKAYFWHDVGFPYSFAIKLPNTAPGAPLSFVEHHPQVHPNLEKFR